jgi:hypothetical protein
MDENSRIVQVNKRRFIRVLEGGMSDTFLEYRIRHLVFSGIFEITGNPKSIRYYSVKLK